MTDFEEQDVEITPELIKLVTGQFDLGSVLSLPLCGLGIRAIDNLDTLSSLTVLDLSNNKLTRLAGLGGLSRSLQRINLRNNLLTKVEGLQALQNLQVAKLQGNKVADVDTILSLAGLPRLRAIYLKDVDGGNANPVCAVTGYRDAILRRLQQLGNLDGEYFLSDDCRPRVVGDGESEDIVIPHQTRWVPKHLTSLDSLTKSDTYLCPSAAMVQEILEECQGMLLQADKSIERQVAIRAIIDT